MPTDRDDERDGCTPGPPVARRAPGRYVGETTPARDAAEARSARAQPGWAPPPATAEQLARWGALGPAKFQDREYQAYAQAHRTSESLREAGRAGYSETVSRHGRDFATDILARHRRQHPTVAERAMIDALNDVGQREGADYVREHQVAPRVYADFAWPERWLAVEVHGTAHEASFFAGKGLLEREARRAAVYEREGWTVQVVTWRELREQPAATRERVRALLAEPAGEQGRLW